MDVMSRMATAVRQRGVSGCGAVGLAGPEYDYCDFIGSWKYSEAAKQIQELLKQKGATKLATDGLWGPCTDKAFQNIYGEPLTQESLQRLLGVTCKTFSKQVSGSCPNGSDQISTVSVPPKTSTTVPATASDWYMRLNLTKTPVPLDVKTSMKIVPKTDSFFLPVSRRVAGAEQSSTVNGLPDWALAVGVVALAAGAAYLYKKRK